MENKEKIIKYWVDSSDEDFETMMVLYNTKRYSWALFIGHLMLEKILKAYFVKEKSDYPPYIHNLIRIAELSNIETNEDQKKQLITITAFNINSRYDDYKMSFAKLCTKEYTSIWINNITSLRLWIKTLILQ